MDVTPLIPQGRQLIERYGNGGFRGSGESLRDLRIHYRTIGELLELLAK